MNYSHWRVTRRQSEWKGGEVSVARENICEEGRRGGERVGQPLGDRQGQTWQKKTPDDTSASTVQQQPSGFSVG